MDSYYCMACCCKHVSSAMIYLAQWSSGYYPQDRHLAHAELWHAEQHMIGLDAAIAAEIVSIRKRIEGGEHVDLYPLLCRVDALSR